MGYRILFILALLVPAISLAGPGNTYVDPLLEQKLNEADSVEVIVTFSGEGMPGTEHIELLESAGFTGGLIYQSFPVAGVIAAEDQVDKLAASDEVVSLFYNDKIVLENDDAAEVTGANRAVADLTVTGNGIGILINDSGIDGQHPDVEWEVNLVQNVQGTVNLQSFNDFLPPSFVEDQVNTDLASGHGTHVAGTAAGTGSASDGKYAGIAPGADLIGYGSGEVIFMLDVLSGFDYAIKHQDEYNIRVINNSWGTNNDTGSDFNPDHPVSRATYAAFLKDIVVVFSAGNSGPDLATITGNYKKAPWVITVAASHKNKSLAGYSSVGEPGRGGSFSLDGKTWFWEDRPVITAPGSNIKSARATTDGLDLDYDSNPKYTSKTGTSMAAPVTAGTVALMLEADSNLSPLDIRNFIEQTAEPMPGRESWETGAGFLDAFQAVSQVVQSTSLAGTETEQVSGYRLEKNYPNPFNPVTQIEYALSEQARIKLEVYDMLGRHVTTLAEGVQQAGTHSIEFDGSGMASGIYIYRLQTGSKIIIQKMTLAK
ncbi:hypothetical protein BH23BAC3_BH23BAC3_22460 [soil metagenome]